MFVTAAAEVDGTSIGEDPRVAACAAMLPGAGMLAALSGIDPSTVCLDDRVTMLELFERCDAALVASRQRLLASLGYGDAGDGEDDWIREEVAAALGIAAGTAGSRLTVARALVGRFPAMLALLGEGRTTYGHARVLVEATAQLGDAHAGRVERRVLGRAEELPVGEFRRLVERVAAAVDPRAAGERHAEARSDRRVWRRGVPDGMAVLGGVVPTEQAAAAWAVLSEEAHRVDPDDPRTVEQRRADAFIDRLTGTHPDYASPPSSTSGGARVGVDVVVSLDTLSGESGAGGELDGRQVLTPGQARALAFSPGAVWRRLVTDPGTGQMVAHSDKTYRPGAGTVSGLLADPVEPPPPVVGGYRPGAVIARWVRARDRQCCFPGCRRRARACDLDHTHPWPHGPTTVGNLRPLCRRHHRLKHHAGWRLVNNPDGSWTWTSSLGRRYTGRPHDYNDRDP